MKRNEEADKAAKQTKPSGHLEILKGKGSGKTVPENYTNVKLMNC